MCSTVGNVPQRIQCITDGYLGHILWTDGCLVWESFKKLITHLRETSQDFDANIDKKKKKIEGPLYLLRSLALFYFASPVQPLDSGEKSESCFWEHNCYKEEEIWNSREWRGPLGLLQWTQEVARVWELQRSHLATGKPSADISEQPVCLAPPQVIMTSVSSVSISEAIWPLPTPQKSQEQVRLWDVYLI